MFWASTGPGALGLNRRSVEHVARTAIAAFISLLLATLISLPEAYWSAVTTLIVMQSSLGAAITISAQRLVGTAIGALLAGVLASYVGSNIFIFAAGVFVSGLICVVLRFDRNAFRYASITLAIIMLVVHAGGPWMLALHRFIEVSLGIAVGLVLTALWPERHPSL
jgi:uncharacterized membrane protein YgaE (UPF0421/DUF939 family)